MSKPYSSTLQMEVRPKAFYNDYGSRAKVSPMIASLIMLIFTAHVYFRRTRIRLYRAVTQTGEKGEQQLAPSAEKQEVVKALSFLMRYLTLLLDDDGREEGV